MDQLERVAKLIQYNVYHIFRTGDDATDAWNYISLSKIAAGLREKKKWILNPKLDTREVFIEAIANTLYNFAYGNWDALEKAELIGTSRATVIVRIKSILQKSLVALLPLGIFWIVQQTPFALEAKVEGYVLIGFVVWLVVNLLPIIDPNYKETLNTIKEIKDIIPFSK